MIEFLLNKRPKSIEKYSFWRLYLNLNNHGQCD